MATVRGVKGWQVFSVAVLTAALTVAGCGGDDPGADRSAPSTTSGSGAHGIKATVSGRALVGQCVGHQTDAPTVLLEVGMGAPRQSLGVVEEHLAQRTQVCSYDRAGKGGSDPASKPRPVTEVVSDLHAFLAQAARQGATPPYKTWLERARTVQTEAEIREFELPFPRGDNDEGIDTRSDESMLTDPLPADLPYAVMFDERCQGLPPPLQNKQDCSRMLRLLELTARDLAKVGKGGRYVRAPGAGHDIHVTRPDIVLATVDQVWEAALGRPGGRG